MSNLPSFFDLFEEEPIQQTILPQPILSWEQKEFVEDKEITDGKLHAAPGSGKTTLIKLLTNL